MTVDERMEKTAGRILADYGLGREIDRMGFAGVPDRKAVSELLEKLLGIVFPGRFAEKPDIQGAAKRLESLMTQVLPGENTWEITLTFLNEIPAVRALVQTDLQAAFAGDPAATGREEILLCYPGLYAVAVYRLAHGLHRLGVPMIPRIMTEYAHGRTGIDIHPGAVIGDHFFIDHGTGTVIGETAVIGSHVKLYQGVTLGGLTTRGGQSLRGQKRHPTIGDNVTIYAGASVLGGDTVIGRDCVIGSNAFITESVPPCTTVSMKNVELQYQERPCPDCPKTKDHFQ